MNSATSNAAMEKVERERIVRVAKTWERTPYVHMGRVKGAGVDCLTLLAEIFHEAKLIPKIEIPYYPQQWMHHRDAERYMEGLLAYTREIQGDPQPGDIVLWKIGRCFSHGALVIAWPLILHAQDRCMVTLEDASKAAWLQTVGENTSDRGKPREVKYFSFWGR